MSLDKILLVLRLVWFTPRNRKTCILCLYFVQILEISLVLCEKLSKFSSLPEQQHISQHRLIVAVLICSVYDRSKVSWIRCWMTCPPVFVPWRKGWATPNSCPLKDSPRARCWTKSENMRLWVSAPSFPTRPLHRRHGFSVFIIS